MVQTEQLKAVCNRGVGHAKQDGRDIKMYKCQQCGDKAEVQGKQDIDINYDTPFISEWVVCKSCDYTISKDTADKQILLNACESVFIELCSINQNQALIDELDVAITMAK